MNDYLRALHAQQDEAYTRMTMLQGDAWGWNKWYDLMVRLFKFDESKPVMERWPDEVVWKENELRELVKEMEGAWLSQVHWMHRQLDEWLEMKIEEEEE